MRFDSRHSARRNAQLYGDLLIVEAIAQERSDGLSLLCGYRHYASSIQGRMDLACLSRRCQ